MTKKFLASITAVLFMVAPMLTSVSATATTTTIHHAKHAHVVSPHSVIGTPLMYRTVGAGIAYPDSTDPTRFLTPSEQRTFQCIRFHESRNHVVDPGNGSYGWYQFAQWIWYRAIQLNRAFRRFPATPDLATKDEQSAVAVFYLRLNGRFGVEWAAEYGECPGRF